jgi:D-alanine-D-alanine ligase
MAPSAGGVRLVILYGGRSAEHEVSCISAFHVLQAIDPARYDVRLVGITTSGRWVELPKDLATSGNGALPSPDTIADAPTAVLTRLTGEESDDTYDAQVPTVVGADDARVPTVVLPLLHGPMGEDGTVQGLLELRGLAYCGAGVAGSAVAMDKGLAKSILGAAGLPQARHVCVREGDIDPAIAQQVDHQLGWPVFVKPANMGSSIGISKVLDRGSLEGAIEKALRYDEYVVIEEAVKGRELEIGVLGWPDLQVSLPGEIRPSREFYDFEDKYLDGRAELLVPAEIPSETALQMTHLAASACRALRVDSMARVDFFLEQPGRGLLVNEVNTVPGFTPISMFPRLWAASGIPYASLIDRLVSQALRRFERRSRFEVHRG